jgi:hypothetical protein
MYKIDMNASITRIRFWNTPPSTSSPDARLSPLRMSHTVLAFDAKTTEASCDSFTSRAPH